jgi:translation initiation factor 1
MAKKTRGKGWELIPASSQSRLGKLGQSESPGEQRIKIREEKRNRGKIVTIASGFKLTDADLKALAKKLKASCGSGGTIHAAKIASETSTIELQGQHKDKVADFLSSSGYQTSK